MSQTISPEFHEVHDSNPPAREAAGWRLLRACTGGESGECWSALVGRFGRQLERSVRRLLFRFGESADAASVQDVMQEVYLRLFRARERPSGRFRGASDAEADSYLHRIALRIVLDARRDAAAAKRGGGARPLHLEVSVAEKRPAPRSDAPDFRIERRESRARFRRRCRELFGARATPHSVRVAELAILDGLSSREIVRIFGGRLRETGVNSTLFRLRRRIERSGGALPRRLRRAAGAPR